MKEHIFLIGYRAAGKTTIGRSLAEMLGYDFVDTDRLVCRNHNAEIAEIVAEEGWESFRRYEAQALNEAARGRRKVVATGGGAVLHQRFWQDLRGRAFVVWLSADTAVLAARLQRASCGEAVRPSLTGNAICDEIEDVLAERLPLYRAFADLQVDTGRSDAPEIIRQIITEYRRKCGNGSDR